MYQEKTYNFDHINSKLSQTTLNEHYKLYQGYVKNTNFCLEKIKSPDLDDYTKSEIRRRLAFEFNGMKNHEFYFEDISTPAKMISNDSLLASQIIKQFGSIENWLTEMKQAAKTRGIGWAITSFDLKNEMLIIHFVDEQHLGQLNDTFYIIGIDMWEHSFVHDYLPSGKSTYIDDYFNLVNFEFAEKRFDHCLKLR